MSEFTIWISLLCFVVLFIAYMIWVGRPDIENIVCADGILTKTKNKDEESMELSNLYEIKYHYHAVVGFISEWEFIDKYGKSLRVDGEIPGIDKVLAQLEELLPKFSLNEFKKKFDAGDMEDSIDVWRSE